MSDEPSAIEGASTALTEAFIEAADVLARPVVPIYQLDRRGRPEQFGSGFFVRSGGVNFLVSAAHVLERSRVVPLYYYIKPRVMRQLDGRFIANRFAGDREKDPIDLAVMRMHGDAQPPYKDVDKWAIDVSYLRSTGSDRSAKTFMIIGFPASRSAVNPIARNITASAYSYRTRSADGDRYQQLNFRPSQNLLLPLDLRKGFDLYGKRVNFPRPQGMSGSPVWLFFADNEPLSEHSRFSVVAVATKYLKTRKLMVATDVSRVVKMIERLSTEPTR